MRGASSRGSIDLASLGLRRSGNGRRFLAERAPVEPGRMLYLSTDGFVDQPAADGRRVGTRRFIDLLDRIRGESLELQREAIADSVASFEGEQRDDITVIGVRI